MAELKKLNNITLRAEAKINLSLDILRKRPDGYHDVEMILQSVDLSDIIDMEKTEKGIEILCGLETIPSDRRGDPAFNTAWKAADILMKRYSIKGGVRISIKKNIPVSAGLAGGSSDAAAVLKGINILYELGLDRETLKNAAACVGSDVPFCIEGGTAFAEGTGTRLRQLPPHEGFSLLIVAPRFEVKTAWAYAGFDSVSLPVSERPDTNLLIDALSRSKTALMAANMKNVLESVTAAEYPLIHLLKESLTDCGALGSIMSGSGPSVFGIFKNRSTAEKAAKQIESIINEKTLSAGREGSVAAAYFVTQTTCASGLTNDDSIADKRTFIGNNKAAGDTSLPEE